MYLKIRRRNGVEFLTTFEEGEFKLAIDGCISDIHLLSLFMLFHLLQQFAFHATVINLFYWFTLEKLYTG